MASTKRSKASPQNSSRASAEAPELASAIEAAVAAVLPQIVKLVVNELENRRGARGQNHRAHAKRSVPAIDAIFAAAQLHGAGELRSLLDLPTEALHGLVSELALDPSRRTRRWKDRERLRDFVVDGVMARVQRQRTLLKTSGVGDLPKIERRVDWRAFYAVVEERGVQAQPFLRLIAVPQRHMNLAIDDALLSHLQVMVSRRFRVAANEALPRRVDAVELVLQETFGSGRWTPTRTARWMRGCDGSVGFGTPIESPHARGHISLWEVAMDCLRFMQLVADALSGETLEVTLEFQPADLLVTAASLEPARQVNSVLPDMPRVMRRPTPAIDPRFEITEQFTPIELGAPFAKLAAMLHFDWGRIFNLSGSSIAQLVDSLKRIAAAELGWV